LRKPIAWDTWGRMGERRGRGTWLGANWSARGKGASFALGSQKTSYGQTCHDMERGGKSPCLGGKDPTQSNRGTCYFLQRKSRNLKKRRASDPWKFIRKNQNFQELKKAFASRRSGECGNSGSFSAPYAQVGGSAKGPARVCEKSI